MQNIPAIPRTCACCSKVYFSDESRFTCSQECKNILAKEFYEDKVEELELTLRRLQEAHGEGDISKEYFMREWNMAIYDAEHIRDIKIQDIKRITETLTQI